MGLSWRSCSSLMNSSFNFLEEVDFEISFDLIHFFFFFFKPGNEYSGQSYALESPFVSFISFSLYSSSIVEARYILIKLHSWHLLHIFFPSERNTLLHDECWNSNTSKSAAKHILLKLYVKLSRFLKQLKYRMGKLHSDPSQAPPTYDWWGCAKTSFDF